jgi:hypothetical protein
MSCFCVYMSTHGRLGYVESIHFIILYYSHVIYFYFYNKIKFHENLILLRLWISFEGSKTYLNSIVFIVWVFYCSSSTFFERSHWTLSKHSLDRPSILFERSHRVLLRDLTDMP